MEIEKAVNYTIGLCPQYFNAKRNVVNIFNNMTSSIISQSAIIACEAEHLNNLRNTVNDVCNSIYIIAFFVGTVSTVLSLCAYMLVDKFKATAFHYYRAINVFDFIYLIEDMYYGFKLNKYVNTTVGSGFALFMANTSNVAGKTARLLVVWLAVDRSVACQWPSYYAQIDSRRFASWIIFACLVISLTYNAPFAYYDFSVRLYSGVRPDRALAIFDRIFRGFEGLVMLILMPLVIAGFIKMSRRKRRLISENQSHVASGKAMLDMVKTNRWLCVLQLCEGVPHILNTGVIYASFLVDFTSLTRNNSLYLKNVTYEENVAYQKLFEIQQYFVVIVGLLDAYNHAGHFYTYFLCSPKFRRTLINAIKRKVCHQVASSSPNWWNTGTSFEVHNVKSRKAERLNKNVKVKKTNL